MRKRSRKPKGFTYPFEEFYEHCRMLFALKAPVNDPDTVEAVQRHFAAQFKDPDEYEFKFLRFGKVVEYLYMHMRDFDTDRIGVYGSEETGALVSDRLLKALYTYYIPRKDTELDVEPDMKWLFDLARYYDKVDGSYRSNAVPPVVAQNSIDKHQ